MKPLHDPVNLETEAAKRVLAAHRECPFLSLRSLAKQAGASHAFVKRVLDAQGTVRRWSRGADGKARRIPVRKLTDPALARTRIRDAAKQLKFYLDRLPKDDDGRAFIKRTLGGMVGSFYRYMAGG